MSIILFDISGFYDYRALWAVQFWRPGREPKMNGLLLCLLASWAVAKAQNIYEGCGSEKKCLGFEKGLDDVQTTCLASQVTDARPLTLHGVPSARGLRLSWLRFGMFRHLANVFIHLYLNPISPSRTGQIAELPGSKSTQPRSSSWCNTL